MAEVLSQLSPEEVDARIDQLSKEELEALITNVESDNRIEIVLNKLDALVTSDEFAAETASFLCEHCHVFTEDEENKLEYTSIHQAFEALVESHLETLGKDYEFLCQHFDEVISNPGDLDETRMETIEMLLGFVDFEIFKNTMLSTKSELRLRVLQKQLDELGEGEDGAAEAQQEVPQ
jgi:hypothetical protein